MGGKRKDTEPIPDLSAYPDLVVVLFGMRVPTLPRVRTLRGFKAPIERGGTRKPAGLLHADDNIVFSLIPLHIGMRWYWRDPAALGAWLGSDAYRLWWSKFLEDTRGTDVWHEIYHPRGGTDVAVRGRGADPDLTALLARPAARCAQGPRRRDPDYAPIASAG